MPGRRGGQGQVLASTLPRAQNRAAKGSTRITKTINFVHLVILFFYDSSLLSALSLIVQIKKTKCLFLIFYIK